MLPSLSVKGHECFATAYVKQGRSLHLISLVGVRESVRAALAAMQIDHSAVIQGKETSLVSLSSQSNRVVQCRLPSGVFHAIAIGERVTQGNILILKDGASLAERFYSALLDKSTLPLHSNWQDKLLSLSKHSQLLTPLASNGVQAYALGEQLGDFESQVKRALVNHELPEIGKPICA